MLRLLLLICFLPLAVPASVPELTVSITSCLTQNSIANFTTYPVTENDSLAYYNILNFSIINLRFTNPSSPKPIVIVLPKNSDELTKTVLCSRKVSLDIRARCGGHSYEGTSSVATDGNPFLIIDLMNLSRVSVDLTSETAWVQGGATLGETYKAISESSSAHGFSAGSCPTVGAGGHISGGGFGLLSRKYGLAADNVIDALLVNADGRLLNREAMGEDMFWAIRGGGGGVFGIVYAWKIQLLKVPPVVSAFIVHRTENRTHVANLLHKWQNVAYKLADEFYLSVFVGANLTGSGTSDVSATFKGFYLGPRSKAVSMLSQAYPELSIWEEDCAEMSWIDSIVYFSGLPNGTSVADLGNQYLKDRTYFKAKADYVRAPISYNGILTALDILEKEPKGYIILDPYGGIMDRIRSEAIAFPHRKGNLFTIQYLVEWQRTDDHNRDKYLEWIREFYVSMTPHVSNGPRAAYINYLDHDLGVKQLIRGYTPFEEAAVEEARSWGEKYFLQNYDRLVKAKTIIDPNNVFNSEQGIPPMSCSDSDNGILITDGSA